MAIATSAALTSLLLVQLLTFTLAKAAPLPYQAIFNGPAGMALSDGHLWVTDSLANEVVELNAANGSFVRFVNAAADRFKSPSDIVSVGHYLWVTSSNCVTQLNASDGSLVRVLKAQKYHFDVPSSIQYGDAHIWMVSGGNAKNDSEILELNPANGALVRVITSSDLANPSALTINGPDVWVANQMNSTVAEFSAANGSLLRVLDATNFTTAGFAITRYHFNQPTGLASAGRDVWVADNGNFPLTEIDGSTGALVRVVHATKAWWINNNIVQDGPSGLVTSANRIWIANGGNVVEVNSDDGKLLRVIGAATDALDTDQVIANRQFIWVSNWGTGTVAQLNADNGKLVRLIESRKKVTVPRTS
jgi:outer membrane protein assembly factor BamB